MNIAKKSTSKNGKLLNENFDGNNANTILILEDDTHKNSTQSSGMNNLSVENGDDVIICNVELPNHVSNAPTSTGNNISELTNGQVKRSIENNDFTANKRLKANQPPFNVLPGTLGYGGPKMILLTSEHLNSLIKEALKEELINYQKDIKNEYNKEIRELKIAMEHWRQTAQKLHCEILQMKNKKSGSHVATPQVKDLPCNLPPASANPVTSQHLKIIHNSNLMLNQSVTSPTKRGPALPFTGTPVVIQPKTISPPKQGGVIDLTAEDEVSKAKTVIQSSQDINPMILGELSTSNSNKLATEQVTDSPQIPLKIPPPPLPPFNQPAPPNAKDLPSKPIVNITNDDDGVHLTWDCVSSSNCEEAVSYHLFSYQSQKEAPNKFLWKRVGNMVAMPLPMVCSLVKSKLDRQAAFAIRGVDKHCRLGLFSDVVVLNREIIT